MSEDELTAEQKEAEAAALSGLDLDEGPEFSDEDAMDEDPFEEDYEVDVDDEEDESPVEEAAAEAATAEEPAQVEAEVEAEPEPEHVHPEAEAEAEPVPVAAVLLGGGAPADPAQAPLPAPEAAPAPLEPVLTPALPDPDAGFSFAVGLGGGFSEQAAASVNPNMQVAFSPSDHVATDDDSEWARERRKLLQARQSGLAPEIVRALEADRAKHQVTQPRMVTAHQERLRRQQLEREAEAEARLLAMQEQHRLEMSRISEQMAEVADKLTVQEQMRAEMALGPVLGPQPPAPEPVQQAAEAAEPEAALEAPAEPVVQAEVDPEHDDEVVPESTPSPATPIAPVTAAKEHSMSTTRITEMLTGYSELSELERDFFLSRAGLVPAQMHEEKVLRYQEMALSAAGGYEKETIKLRKALDSLRKVNAALQARVTELSRATSADGHVSRADQALLDGVELTPEPCAECEALQERFVALQAELDAATKLIAEQEVALGQAEKALEQARADAAAAHAAVAEAAEPVLLDETGLEDLVDTDVADLEPAVEQDEDAVLVEDPEHRDEAGSPELEPDGPVETEEAEETDAVAEPVAESSDEDSDGDGDGDAGSDADSDSDSSEGGTDRELSKGADDLGEQDVAEVSAESDAEGESGGDTDTDSDETSSSSSGSSGGMTSGAASGTAAGSTASDQERRDDAAQQSVIREQETTSAGSAEETDTPAEPEILSGFAAAGIGDFEAESQAPATGRSPMDDGGMER